MFGITGDLVIFQSTPSLRKATCPNGRVIIVLCISIHTFLAEGDYTQYSIVFKLRYFNPHLPCGRRRSRLDHSYHNDGISIHTFLAEGDILMGVIYLAFKYFNPHLPCGRRLLGKHKTIIYNIISIHTFLAEGDFFQGFYISRH